MGRSFTFGYELAVGGVMGARQAELIHPRPLPALPGVNRLSGRPRLVPPQHDRLMPLPARSYVQTDLKADRQVANTLAELIIGGALASFEISRRMGGTSGEGGGEAA